MSVHFKFKSEKEFGTVNFPGTTIRVIDLKKAIIEQKKLNKGQDMELVITDFQNNSTVYEDDNQQLPKNTSVIVKRMPAKNNVGILARIAAEQKASAPLQPLQPVATTLLPSTEAPEEIPVTAGAETVEDELEALNIIQQEAEEARNVRTGGNKTWTAGGGNKGPQSYPVGAGRGVARVDTFAGRGPTPQGRGVPLPGPGETSSDAPPPGYICYRCGVPGHFIQNCPTNGNSNHDKLMVKPRTGIPTSLIKPVETPNQAPGYTVVNTGPNGGLAIVVPQVKAFEKMVKASGGGSGLDQYRMNPPEHLACPICKRLMQDAVLIPCCHESACDGCIRNALISHNLSCPLCRKSMSPENLIPNKVTRSSVDEFLKRSQGEAQEREKLVKEAEAKAMLKQQTDEAPRRNATEIADAVLDISKKAKEDEDDDLGGDIFADEPERVAEEILVPSKSPDEAPETSPAPEEPIKADTEPKSETVEKKEVADVNAAGHAKQQDGPPPGWRSQGPPGWYDGPPRPWFDGPPPPWAGGGHFGHPPPHMYYDQYYGGHPPPWMMGPPGYGDRNRSSEKDSKRDDGDRGDKSPRSKRRSRERRRSRDRRYHSRSRSRRRDRSRERGDRDRDSRGGREKKEDDSKSKSDSRRKDESKSKSDDKRKDENKSKTVDKRKEDTKSKSDEKRKVENKSKSNDKRKEDTKSKSDEKRKDESKGKSDVKRKEDTKSKSDEKRKDESKGKSDVKRKDDTKSKSDEKRKEDTKSKPDEKRKDDTKSRTDDRRKDTKTSDEKRKSDSKNENEQNEKVSKTDEKPKDDTKVENDVAKGEENKEKKKDEMKSIEAPAIDLDFLEDDPTTEEKPSTKESKPNDIKKSESKRDDKRVRGNEKRQDDKKDERRRDERRTNDKQRVERRHRDDKKTNDRGRDVKRRRSRSRGRRSSERTSEKKRDKDERPAKKRSVLDRLGPAVK